MDGSLILQDPGYTANALKFRIQILFVFAEQRKMYVVSLWKTAPFSFTSSDQWRVVIGLIVDRIDRFVKRQQLIMGDSCQSCRLLWRQSKKLCRKAHRLIF